MWHSNEMLKISKKFTFFSEILKKSEKKSKKIEKNRFFTWKNAFFWVFFGFSRNVKILQNFQKILNICGFLYMPRARITDLPEQIYTYRKEVKLRIFKLKITSTASSDFHPREAGLDEEISLKLPFDHFTFFGTKRPFLLAGA